MSCTEIVAFKKDGKAVLYEEVKNAWRGAFKIWGVMNDAYLNSTANVLFNPIPVFELYKNKGLDRTDRIVLGSTFDRVIITKETLEEVIKAFREFASDNEGSSLDEQADILTQILEDEEYIAVAFNQTSICENRWVTTVHNVDTDEYSDEGYDCINGQQHFNLIEDINKMESEGFNGN